MQNLDFFSFSAAFSPYCSGLCLLLGLRLQPIQSQKQLTFSVLGLKNSPKSQGPD